LHRCKKGAKNQRHGIDEKELIGGLGQTILLARKRLRLAFYRNREEFAGSIDELRVGLSRSPDASPEQRYSISGVSKAHSWEIQALVI